MESGVLPTSTIPPAEYRGPSPIAYLQQTAATPANWHFAARPQPCCPHLAPLRMAAMSDRPDRIPVRFSVLGPVSIDDGTQTVILPSAKPVSLLAAMLLRPNRVVPVDYLQNAVWGENAADTT